MPITLQGSVTLENLEMVGQDLVISGPTAPLYAVKTMGSLISVGRHVTLSKLKMIGSDLLGSLNVIGENLAIN